MARQNIRKWHKSNVHNNIFWLDNIIPSIVFFSSPCHLRKVKGHVYVCLVYRIDSCFYDCFQLLRMNDTFSGFYFLFDINFHLCLYQSWKVKSHVYLGYRVLRSFYYLAIRFWNWYVRIIFSRCCFFNFCFMLFSFNY